MTKHPLPFLAPKSLLSTVASYSMYVVSSPFSSTFFSFNLFMGEKKYFECTSEKSG